MKLRIMTDWLPSVRAEFPPSTNENLADSYPMINVSRTSYPSVGAMQKELKRRFPHCNPATIPNGIRMNCPPYRYQEITLLDE